jgi:hypothetical protein
MLFAGAETGSRWVSAVSGELMVLTANELFHSGVGPGTRVEILILITQSDQNLVRQLHPAAPE